MELEQWIQLFHAVSSTTASREKGKWLLFASSFVTCTGLLFIGVSLFVQTLSKPASIGIAALGLAIAIAWSIIQQRLSAECAHWNRILRSIESQFAGTEFHRSIHRLSLGEQVCVPTSAWVCDEWRAEAARFPLLSRKVPDRLLLSVPFLYGLAFLSLLIGIVLP